MKKKYDFCLSLGLILTAFLLAMSGVRKNEEALAARIAPEILRFHVLANSDTPEDQALKLEVKELLLEEIRDGLSAAQTDSDKPDSSQQQEIHSAVNTFPDNSISRESVIHYILENQTALEQSAEHFIAQRGFDYTAEVSLETCEFPQRTYGDMTFPAGIYDAVRVVLGAGEGQNFWCVLYPSLCYIDSTYAVVPDSSKEALQTLIPEDDFLALLSARKISRRESGDSPSFKATKEPEQDSLLPRLNIRFKLTELFD